MTDGEVENIMITKRIELENGLDPLPGKMLFLDSENIVINGERDSIRLYAWYDQDDDRKCKMFIINVEDADYLFIQYFHEAVAVWQYYLKCFPVPND